MRTGIELLHPSELSKDDVRAWSQLQGGAEAFSNPLLGSEFAIAVGEVRQDARVAIWRQDGSPQAFLAYHKRPSAFARPIGAPFSDMQALIGAPTLAISGGELLRAAGIRALKVNGLVDPYGAMIEGAQKDVFSKRIIVSGDAASLDLSRNSAKNFKRYSQKLIQDVGELSFVAPEREHSALSLMLSWKAEQLQRTGLHDFFQAAWIRALFDRLFATRDGRFEGLMMSLYAGKRLVAGQFGVRLGGHYHPWIAAMDPELKAYSPGTLFQRMAIEAMPGLGLSIYELGVDGDHWKQNFATATLPMRSGVVTAADTAGRLAATSARLAEWPVAKVQTIGRLSRRLDHIAAAELTFAGRTKGVIDALASFDRRNAARQTH